MTADRLRDRLDEGEALRHESSLRDGGRLGVTDDRLLVASAEETVSVPLENVGEITIQSFDWFMAILSAVLVVIAVPAGRNNLLVGVAFVAAALANLYLTYRKRDRVRVAMHTRDKPLTLYPADVDATRDALEAALDRFKARYEEG